MDPAIEVVELTKRYGEVPAVDAVTFEVSHGEVFGLLGPNGAGKTTTVECILGLRQPDGGEIRLLGLAQRERLAAVRPRVGVQLQTTGLLRHLRVAEQVRLFRSLFPRALPQEEVLALTGLQELGKATTASLSGGQRQRLALALALVNDPDLVFLDEPSAGLDPQARRRVWEIIDNLRGRGKTVLLTTHYLEEAEQLCDRVAIMDHGRIIELDSPGRLIRRHFRETAIELPAPPGLEREELAALPGVRQTLFENGRATLYTAEVADALVGLSRYLADQNQTLDGIAVRQACLEDVFIKLTGRRIRE